MTMQFYKVAFLWGFILWLIGYVLGIALFAFVPTELLGWIISPIGIIITLWVLIKKVKLYNFQQYLAVAIVWTLLAIILDYLLLVQLFKPADGYYKLDVYLYYGWTFVLPIIIGLAKRKKVTPPNENA